MLCSECSNEVRPIVAVDIDGTLGDYHKHFTWFCGNYWNKTDLFTSEPWNGEGEFEEFLGLTKEQYREAKLAYRQGGMKRWLPLFPGAEFMMQQLHKAGAEVWIATTRPWQRLDNIDPDTREWLRRNEIHYDGLLYGEDKYGQLCEAVDRKRVVAVIEDLPFQVRQAKSLGLPVILRENHHNSTVSGNYVPRGSLDVCGVWAVNKIERWLDDDNRQERDVHA